MAVSQTYEKNVEFNLSAVREISKIDGNFNRTGYSFKNWYRYDEQGNIHTYQDEGNATFIAEVTNLSAAWNAISYNITYANVQAGENPSTNPSTYTIESPNITFDPALRNGYGCTWNPTGIAHGSTGHVTTTAQWQLCTYTISYLGLDQGDVNPDTNPRTYTIETVGKTFDPATRTGYTCTWNPTGFSTGSTGNLSTTASWTINKHTITYVPQQTEGQIAVGLTDGSQVYNTGDEVEYNSLLSVYVVENEGYRLSSITMNGTDITETRTFNMPDEPVAINITWNDIQGIVYFHPGY